MKKILFFLMILLVFSCRTEEDAGPANENTFIRYFGNEHNNTAVLALETADGFTLLSNTEMEGSTEANRKIKLIKTDLFGNPVWEKDYPSFNRNWTAASFIEITDPQLANPGYLIIGDSIKTNNTTSLLLLKTDNQGILLNSVTIPAPANTSSLHGRAVTVDPQGDYIILGSISDENSVNDMYVAKINASDLSVAWSRVYGAGSSNTINRIYYNTDENLLWGGSVQNSSSLKYDVRLVRAPENSQTPIIGNPIGSPEADENATDLCETFGGWAITGSTNETGTEDIYILKVNNNSQTIFSTRLQGEDGQNERGVSIASTDDSGLIVLGTVGTAAKKEDLSIIKINASGLEVWRKYYGGADRQEGASIRVTSNGSYLVFGTTYFINEAKLMLMKVNKDGTL